MSTIKQQQAASTATTHALRISEAFARAERERRGALMPYVMCGYPSVEQSARLVLAAAEAGADIIELGMPFSDPLADGATIQHAGQIALEGGMTIRGCMEIARQVAAQSTIPLILMGYYNPLLSYGIERFCRDAAESGVCGLIIPDLPPEEAGPLQEAALQAGLALIFLVPPTTPDERIAQVVEQAANIPGSFIYCVSVSGVTGARDNLPDHLPLFLQRVHSYTKKHGLPMTVGFGLSRPEHISAVVQLAEGAVVASALVNLLDQRKESEQVEAAKRFIGELRQATTR